MKWLLIMALGLTACPATTPVKEVPIPVPPLHVSVALQPADIQCHIVEGQPLRCHRGTQSMTEPFCWHVRGLPQVACMPEAECHTVLAEAVQQQLGLIEKAATEKSTPQRCAVFNGVEQCWEHLPTWDVTQTTHQCKEGTPDAPTASAIPSTNPPVKPGNTCPP